MAKVPTRSSLTLELTRETLRFLQRYAAAHGMTPAELVDRVLDWLREREAGGEDRELFPAGTEVAPASNGIRARFERLAGEWRKDTRLLSSLTEMVTHPAYQRIIGLGQAAVPLLLEKLQDQPGQWFWALKAITGDDPVNEESRGDVKAMSDAWLSWGRRHGYC